MTDPYSLGVELSSEAVRWATASSPGDSTIDVVTWPPTIVFEGPKVVAGPEATEKGLQQPENTVQDLVAQFRVDRIWLTSGRIVTPDEALTEMLGAVDSAASAGAAGQRPAEVVVGHPGDWHGPVLVRLQDVAVTAFRQAELVSGLGAADLARRGASRLPAIDENGGWEATLPALEHGFVRQQAPPPAAPDAPQRAGPDRRRTWLAVLGIAIGIVLVVALSVWALHRPKGAAHAAESTTTLLSTIPATAPTTVIAPTGLTIGVISSTSQSDVQAALGSINGAGGVLGHPVAPLTATGTNQASGVQQLIEQGAGGIVTDATGSTLSTILAAATTDGVAVCTDNGLTDAPVGATVIDSDSLGRCVEALALGSIDAGSTESTEVASGVRDVAGTNGVACSSFSECRAYLKAEQPIEYLAADGRPALQLVQAQ